MYRFPLSTRHTKLAHHGCATNFAWFEIIRLLLFIYRIVNLSNKIKNGSKISCFYGNLENTRTTKCVYLRKFGTVKLIGILSKAYTGILNKIIIGNCSNQSEMLASQFIYGGKNLQNGVGQQSHKKSPLF